jgi:uncharacterized membrane protein
MSVGRLEAFSDGVLAIVITLLILDIKVPAGATGHLGRELARMWPHYAAYLLSFLVVGIIWLNHHAVVQLLARTNHTVQAVNLLLLLSVSVLPWPTAVLSDYLREGTRSDQRISVVLYGVSIDVMGIAFTILWRYVFRHHELHRPDVDRKALAVRYRRNSVGLVAYPLITVLGLLSAALFIALILAWAFVCLLPTPDVRSGGPRQDDRDGEAGAQRASPPRGRRSTVNGWQASPHARPRWLAHHASSGEPARRIPIRNARYDTPERGLVPQPVQKRGPHVGRQGRRRTPQAADLRGRSPC